MSAPLELCYRQFALRVESIRSAIGMTQLDLSKKVGLDRTSVANLETGRQRVQLHQVEKYAQALGTTPKHLMKGIWW